MGAIATVSNQFKYSLARGEINLESDVVKILLIRDGFSFDKDTYSYKKNIKATVTDTMDFSNQTITASNIDFENEGFLPNQRIKVVGSSNNNGEYIISSVFANNITVTTTLVSESNTDNVTMSVNEEIPTGNGYTQDDKQLTITLTKDDTNDYLLAAFDDVIWTASGGDITAGGALVYDATSNIIIGYFDFGAVQTATDGANFVLASGSIRIL